MRILALTFGPAGKLLLAASADGVVELWDASFRLVCRTHTGNNGPVWSAAIHPGGGAYARGGNDGTVRIATLSSAAPEITAVKLCEGPVPSLAFAARGNILAAGGYGAHVPLYDWAARRRVDALPMQSPVVHCLRFSPDGKRLAAAAGARVRLYNVEEGEKSRIELGGHRKSVWSLAFSPDGALFASSGRDAAIRIWDAAGGFAFQRQLSAHINSVWALDFSALPRLLASGGADGTIRVWNPQTGERGDAVDTGHGCVQARRAWRALVTRRRTAVQSAEAVRRVTVRRPSPPRCVGAGANKRAPARAVSGQAPECARRPPSRGGSHEARRIQSDLKETRGSLARTL